MNTRPFLIDTNGVSNTSTLAHRCHRGVATPSEPS
jgi:hypothetical protein